MGPVRIPIFFDYASTLCYIAWRIVRELEGELGFEALWKGVPIALRDFRAKPGRTLGELERQKVLMVAAETGILVAPPVRWIDSRAALQGSELARDAGAFPAYHDAVFRAAFEAGDDISRPAVLEAIAERAGMDRADFRAGLASGRMESRLADHKREAEEFSALGYPTFILGDFPLIGIQPIESMRLLLGRYIQQRSDEPQA
ncbi:MAG TPA: DsbA family protein [Sporolactobacillaceae bacterium]|nr:DsbA family protein [Sporolactobacillaceae bacterium]